MDDGPETVDAFEGWLNGVRERNGLPPVMLDPRLTRAADANNEQQEHRGLGHYFMGPAVRQNAGMGTLGAVCAEWLESPPHRAALLDPNITRIGIAYSASGRFWTFNGS